MTDNLDAVRSIGAHATVRRDGGTAWIELVGAKSMNVLGTPMIADLTRAVQETAALIDVRVIVLRGSGDTSFMGGGDIFEMARLNRRTGEVFIRSLKGLCDAITQARQPVIARLAGWCLGGGLEVALACDLRIGGQSSMYGMPEVSVGIPSVIHSALLPALVGESRAAYFLLSCENINADTALQWGLVHEVVADTTLDDRIRALAAKLGAFGPEVLAQQKRLLRKWRTMSIDGAIEDSVSEFGRAFETGEPQHFMGEFVERKRHHDSAGSGHSL
ncbi:enoyl-CoA hydratase [Rhodococcus sp. KBW08]|uniref:enoyl-CoA hydratase n=1 Tax=Rhodococcus sp. KBW08 TaxID=2144188 RepID=UPI000F5A53D4|nr:enoyl-CoA hydratase [Rhodococcus sp. KBW08]RQO46036.1 enoyl-CoA hydratase [Rhodococcus sp. KBW08]